MDITSAFTLNSNKNKINIESLNEPLLIEKCLSDATIFSFLKTSSSLIKREILSQTEVLSQSEIQNYQKLLEKIIKALVLIKRKKKFKKALLCTARNLSTLFKSQKELNKRAIIQIICKTLQEYSEMGLFLLERTFYINKKESENILKENKVLKELILDGLIQVISSIEKNYSQKNHIFIKNACWMIFRDDFKAKIEKIIIKLLRRVPDKAVKMTEIILKNISFSLKLDSFFSQLMEISLSELSKGEKRAERAKKLILTICNKFVAEKEENKYEFWETIFTLLVKFLENKMIKPIEVENTIEIISNLSTELSKKQHYILLKVDPIESLFNLIQKPNNISAKLELLNSLNNYHHCLIQSKNKNENEINNFLYLILKTCAKLHNSQKKEDKEVLKKFLLLLLENFGDFQLEEKNVKKQLNILKINLMERTKDKLECITDLAVLNFLKRLCLLSREEKLELENKITKTISTNKNKSKEDFLTFFEYYSYSKSGNKDVFVELFSEFLVEYFIELFSNHGRDIFEKMPLLKNEFNVSIKNKSEEVKNKIFSMVYSMTLDKLLSAELKDRETQNLFKFNQGSAYNIKLDEKCFALSCLFTLKSDIAKNYFILSCVNYISGTMSKIEYNPNSFDCKLLENLSVSEFFTENFIYSNHQSIVNVTKLTLASLAKIGPAQEKVIFKKIENLIESLMSEILETFGKEDEVIYFTPPNTVSKVNCDLLSYEPLDKKALARKYPALNIQEDFNIILEQEEVEKNKFIENKRKEILEKESETRGMVSSKVTKLKALLSLTLDIFSMQGERDGVNEVEILLPILLHFFDNQLIHCENFEWLYKYLLTKKDLKNISYELCRLYSDKTKNEKLIKKIFKHFAKWSVFKNPKNAPVFFMISPTLKNILSTEANKIDTNIFSDIQIVLLEITDSLIESETPFSVAIIKEVFTALLSLLRWALSFAAHDKKNSETEKSDLKSEFTDKKDVLINKVHQFAIKLGQEKSVFDLLIGNEGLFSPFSEIRKVCIECLKVKFSEKFDNKRLFGKIEMEFDEQKKFLGRIFCCCFDEEKTVSSQSKKILENIKNNDFVIKSEKDKEMAEVFVSFLSDENDYTREIASKTVRKFCQNNPPVHSEILKQIKKKYQNKRETPKTKESLLKCLSNCAEVFFQTENKNCYNALEVFSFLIENTFEEIMWEKGLKTSLEFLSHTADEDCKKLTDILEKRLKNISENSNAIKVNETLKKGVVFLLAAVTEKISDGNPNTLKSLLDLLLNALKTSSKELQEHFAAIVEKIYSKQKPDEETTKKFIGTLLANLMSKNDGTQYGSALGLAAVVCGSGFDSFFNFGLMDRLETIVRNNHRTKHQEGAFLAVSMLQRKQKVKFEPFFVHFAKIAFSNLERPLNIELLIETVLNSVSKTGLLILVGKLVSLFENQKWRCRLNAIETAGKIMKKHWEKIDSLNIKKVIDALVIALSDTNLTVRAAAETSLKTACHSFKVPELALSNTALYKALIQKEKESVSEFLPRFVKTTFYYKFEEDFICVLIPILSNASKTNEKNIKLSAIKALCALTHFAREKNFLNNFFTVIFESLQNCLFDISTSIRSESSFAVATVASALERNYVCNIFKWGEDTLHSEKANQTKILGIAELFSNLISLSKNPRLVYEKSLIPFSKSPDSKLRECFFSAIGFFAQTDANSLLAANIFKTLLNGLSDEDEETSKSAYIAGGKFTSALASIVIESELEEFLSLLQEGIISENESKCIGCIKLSAVFIISLGDSFSKTEKWEEILANEDALRVEKTFMSFEKLQTSSKLQLLSAIYYSRFDRMRISKTANEAWKVLVYHRKGVLDRILPFLVRRICQSLSNPEKQGAARKALSSISDNSKEGRPFHEIMLSTLKHKTNHSDPMVRSGMHSGVAEIIRTSQRESFSDESFAEATELAFKALFDEDETVRISGSDLIDSVAFRLGSECFLQNVQKMGESFLEKNKFEERYFEMAITALRVLLDEEKSFLGEELIKGLTEIVFVFLYQIGLSENGTKNVNELYLMEFVKIISAKKNIFEQNFNKILFVLARCSRNSNNKVKMANNLVSVLMETKNFTLNDILLMVLSAFKTSKKENPSYFTNKISLEILAVILQESGGNEILIPEENLSIAGKVLFKKLCCGETEEHSAAKMALENASLIKSKTGRQNLFSVMKNVELCVYLEKVTSIKENVFEVIKSLALSMLSPKRQSEKEITIVLISFVVSFPRGNSEENLPFVGPLIRFLNESFDERITSLLLDGVKGVIQKSGGFIKPFLPQLIVSLVKFIGTSERDSLRNQGGATLELLIRRNPFFEERLFLVILSQMEKIVSFADANAFGKMENLCSTARRILKMKQNENAHAKFSERAFLKMLCVLENPLFTETKTKVKVLGICSKLFTDLVFKRYNDDLIVSVTKKVLTSDKVEQIFKTAFCRKIVLFAVKNGSHEKVVFKNSLADLIVDNLYGLFGNIQSQSLVISDQKLLKYALEFLNLLSGKNYIKYISLDVKIKCKSFGEKLMMRKLDSKTTKDLKEVLTLLEEKLAVEK